MVFRYLILITIDVVILIRIFSLVLVIIEKIDVLFFIEIKTHYLQLTYNTKISIVSGRNKYCK